MSLKEYHRLADLFSKLNSQENIEDDFTSMPDAETVSYTHLTLPTICSV